MLHFNTIANPFYGLKGEISFELFDCFLMKIHFCEMLQNELNH
jgi:hypothetical protein